MKESDIQSEIMIALAEHPLVSWVYVTSTGTFKGLKGGRPIRVGIPGLPDILGQMQNGRLLGIEVKQPGKTPTPVQHEFLAMINGSGGLAGWCDCVKGAIDIINKG